MLNLAQRCVGTRPDPTRLRSPLEGRWGPGGGARGTSRPGPHPDARSPWPALLTENSRESAESQGWAACAERRHISVANGGLNNRWPALTCSFILGLVLQLKTRSVDTPVGAPAPKREQGIERSAEKRSPAALPCTREALCARFCTASVRIRCGPGFRTNGPRTRRRAAHASRYAVPRGGSSWSSAVEYLA